MKRPRHHCQTIGVGTSTMAQSQQQQQRVIYTPRLVVPAGGGGLLKPKLIMSSSSMRSNKKQRPEVVASPSAYLRTLFASVTSVPAGGVGVSSTNNSSPSSNNNNYNVMFRKPTEEDIEAYDLEVVKSIRSKDLVTLQTLHRGGKNLNACNQFGESLLHMACRRGDVAMVSFMLLEAKVRVEIRDDFGRTPFHDACWTSTPNLDVMDILLQVANPYMMLSEDVRGSVPFDYARKEHYAEWINYLQSRKGIILTQLQKYHQPQPSSKLPNNNPSPQQGLVKITG